MGNEGPFEKKVKLYGLPDVRISGKPDGDTYITVGTNSLRVDQFLETVESDTPGDVTTEDCIKALEQVMEKVRVVVLAELSMVGAKLRRPKL